LKLYDDFIMPAFGTVFEIYFIMPAFGTVFEIYLCVDTLIFLL